MRDSIRVPKKYLTRDEGLKLAREYAASGMTRRAFASRAGIQVNRLCYWLRQAKHHDPGSSQVPSFLEITSASVVNPSRQCYKLQLPGGIILDVPSGFSAEEVRQLLTILRTV